MDVGKSLPALRRPVSVLDKPLSKGKGEVRARIERVHWSAMVEGRETWRVEGQGSERGCGCGRCIVLIKAPVACPYHPPRSPTAFTLLVAFTHRVHPACRVHPLRSPHMSCSPTAFTPHVVFARLSAAAFSQVSIHAFAFLFAEMVQYAQKRVNGVDELEQKYAEAALNPEPVCAQENGLDTDVRCLCSP